MSSGEERIVKKNEAKTECCMKRTFSDSVLATADHTQNGKFARGFSLGPLCFFFALSFCLLNVMILFQPYGFVCSAYFPI